MWLAENKYKSLKQSGEWGKLTDEEVEIVALDAKIDILKNNNLPIPSPSNDPRKRKRSNRTTMTPKRMTKRKMIRKRKTFIGRNQGQIKPPKQWMANYTTGAPIIKTK